jgi:hypothetical protein
VRRFSSAVDTVIVELTRLSQSDTRLYLVERATHAGLTDLFAPAALDLIVDASRGLPRSLWSIAGLAYFSAASAGAVQISRQHVADALASQITRPEPAEPSVPAAPSVKLFPEAALKAPVAAPVAEPPRENANVAYLAAPSSTPPLTNRQPIAEVPVVLVPVVAPHSETSAAVALPVPGLAGVDSKEPQRERASEAADAPYFLPAFDAALPSDGKQDADAPPVRLEIQEIAAGPIASFDSASAAEGENAVSPLDASSLNLLRDTAANDARKGHRSVVVLGLAASLAAVVVIPAMLLFGKFPGTTNAASAPVATLSIPTQAIPRQASVTSPPSKPVPPSGSQTAIVNNDLAAAEKSDTGNSTRKSASLSRTPDAAKPSGQIRTVKPAKPANDAKAAKATPAPVQPAAAKAPVVPSPAMVAPVQAADVAPAPSEAAVQAGTAPAATANAAAEAEARSVAVAAEVARIMAAQQEAEREKAAKEAAAQAQAAAIRASVARDAANRINAAMQEAQAAQAATQAAAAAQAAKQTAEKERRAFQNSLFGVAH